MTALSIRELRKRFAGPPPVVAVDGADLEVPEGALLAVLGPSGCGKSTLLRCVAGFERPDAGSIEIGGRTVVADGVEVRPEHRRVGIVPQDGALFPHLDVVGNVAFGLRALERNARAARVAELLDLVGLSEYGGRRPAELSGGQQQRVALARALAPRPDVVLLDEPFSALDADLRSTVRAEVAALLARTGTTAVLVTHDQAEALAMADLVAVMRAGRIIQVATPRQLYDRPVDLEVARSVGSGTTIGAVARDGWATSIVGRVAVAPDLAGPVRLHVRPEQVDRDPDGVAATARRVEFGGHDQTVVLSVSGVEVTARWPAALPVEAGSVHHIAVRGHVAAFPDPDPDQPSRPEPPDDPATIS